MRRTHGKRKADSHEGFEEFADAFAEVDGQGLLGLKSSVLKEDFGMKKAVQRKELLAEIKELVPPTEENTQGRNKDVSPAKGAKPTKRSTSKPTNSEVLKHNLVDLPSTNWEPSKTTNCEMLKHNLVVLPEHSTKWEHADYFKRYWVNVTFESFARQMVVYLTLQAAAVLAPPRPMSLWNKALNKLQSSSSIDMLMGAKSPGEFFWGVTELSVLGAVSADPGLIYAYDPEKVAWCAVIAWEVFCAWYASTNRGSRPVQVGFGMHVVFIRDEQIYQAGFLVHLTRAFLKLGLGFSLVIWDLHSSLTGTVVISSTQ